MPEAVEASDLQEVHGRAQRRWPIVGWPLEAYAAHVGEERPPHLEDLYLGGAGGHRVEGSWAAISQELREPLAARLRKQPCGDSSPEDLVSESIATLMAEDPTSELQVEGRRPAKLIRYRGRTTLVNYFLVVAKRLAIGGHRKTRREQREPEQFDPAASTDAPSEDLDRREGAERLFAAVQGAYAALTARQRFLLAMIYGRGLGKSEAGALVSLPPWGVSRELERIHDGMRVALEGVLPEGWTMPSREAWIAAWRRCWSDELDGDMDTDSGPGSEVRS
jgi:DNA-directed RNA polymerase specialized sigma24 family protein